MLKNTNYMLFFRNYQKISLFLNNFATSYIELFGYIRCHFWLYSTLLLIVFEFASNCMELPKTVSLHVVAKKPYFCKKKLKKPYFCK